MRTIYIHSCGFETHPALHSHLLPLFIMAPVPGCFSLFRRSRRNSFDFEAVRSRTKLDPVAEFQEESVSASAVPALGEDLHRYNPCTCNGVAPRVVKDADLPPPPYSGSSGLPKAVSATGCQAPQLTPTGQRDDQTMY